MKDSQLRFVKAEVPVIKGSIGHRAELCDRITSASANRAGLRDGSDTAKAKAAYQDFPTLWKDADLTSLS